VAESSATWHTLFLEWIHGACDVSKHVQQGARFPRGLLVCHATFPADDTSD
jgi:hypothetical protein